VYRLYRGHCICQLFQFNSWQDYYFCSLHTYNIDETAVVLQDPTTLVLSSLREECGSRENMLIKTRAKTNAWDVGKTFLKNSPQKLLPLAVATQSMHAVLRFFYDEQCLFGASSFPRLQRPHPWTKYGMLRTGSIGGNCLRSLDRRGSRA